MYDEQVAEFNASKATPVSTTALEQPRQPGTGPIPPAMPEADAFEFSVEAPINALIDISHLNSKPREPRRKLSPPPYHRTTSLTTSPSCTVIIPSLFTHDALIVPCYSTVPIMIPS